MKPSNVTRSRLSVLAFLAAGLSNLFSRGKLSRSSSTGRPSGYGRFNLAGLPPAWKGRVMRRKLRGGRS